MVCLARKGTAVDGVAAGFGIGIFWGRAGGVSEGMGGAAGIFLQDVSLCTVPLSRERRQQPSASTTALSGCPCAVAALRAYRAPRNPEFLCVCRSVQW